jgi:integral membrane protein
MSAEAGQNTDSAADSVSFDPNKIRIALAGYRIMAWITGIWLIALCYEMIVKYVIATDDIPYVLTLVPYIHGWVYFVYLLATFNLAVKVRWPLSTALGTLVAGTIPLLGVIVEHVRTKEIKARFDL